MTAYDSLGSVVTDLTEILRPPERMTVSQAAELYRKLNNPGSYVGPWLNDKTPYMVEPADLLTDRDYSGIVFIGPAQTGKTDALILNSILYSVVCDPMDMMVYQTSQTMARDFSKRRVDRMHRHSPEVGSRLLPTGSADNVFDKTYRSGMMLTMSWPTINELSGRPVGRVILTDYDRMTQDVDGEGSPFDLARKRTTTFRSSGKTIAESSPGFTVKDPQWIQKSPHEGPPCDGIVALYNRGDRRRWYWRCWKCSKRFEPAFSALIWPTSVDPMESAEQVVMQCPHCGAQHTPGMKHEMNLAGRWLREGQMLDEHNRLYGTATRSDIASFWLKGPAAAFASWQTQVLNYLKAEEEFRNTASQEALKTTVNTDQGEVYYPRGTDRDRLPEVLKDNAEDLPHQIVPEGVRFLLATIDVQKNRWVVQVIGVAPGMDLVVVDRFEIIKSKRKDDDGDTLWVKPATYLEDWDLITEQVLQREYPLDDGTGFMPIKAVGCDSGGRAGVTSMAYSYWRKLKKLGLHTRFHLVKGEPLVSAPRVRQSYPDSDRKDRKAGARGEIPVLMMNVNVLKDDLSARLDRTTPGGGMIRYPSWLPDEFFKELCVEIRTLKGWENPRNQRNEAWDLLVYAIALCIHLRVEKMSWDDPPGWAKPWEENDLIRLVGREPAFAEKPKQDYDLAKFAQALA